MQLFNHKPLKYLISISAFFLLINVATANIQQIYIQENQSNQDNSNIISLDIMHYTDNLDKLTAIGLVLTYDDSALELISIDNLFTGSVGSQTISNKFITGWLEPLPFAILEFETQQLLYTANFRFKTGANQATIKLKPTAISNGYEAIIEEFVVYR